MNYNMANRIVKHVLEHVKGIKTTHFTSEYEGKIYSVDFITERKFTDIIEDLKIIGDIECIFIEDDYMNIELTIGNDKMYFSFWKSKKVSNN
jgi:hypothetical protein